MITLLIIMTLLSLLGCGPKKPAGPDEPGDVRLDYIHYSASHGYHAYSNIGYSAERQADGKTRIVVEVGNDRDRVFEAEASVMDSLDAIVKKYKMIKYHGHYQPKVDILDGDSWSFSMRMSDGTEGDCGGYMAYPPKGGAQALGEVETILSRWLYMEPAEEVALTSFRYELHDAKEGSEVFSARQEKDYVSVYFREMGSREGWNYYCGNPELLLFLSREIRWAHACSYIGTGEKLADEDKTRPRWIAIFEYADGQIFELIDYLDRPETSRYAYENHTYPTITEMELRSGTEQRFKDEISRIGTLTPEEKGRHSKTSYDAQGKALRTINYDGNGDVLNGHDYRDPNLKF